MKHSLASKILVYDFQTAEPKTTFPLKEFSKNNQELPSVLKAVPSLQVIAKCAISLSAPFAS